MTSHILQIPQRFLISLHGTAICLSRKLGATPQLPPALFPGTDRITVRLLNPGRAHIKYAVQAIDTQSSEEKYDITEIFSFDCSPLMPRGKNSNASPHGGLHGLLSG